MSRDEQDLILGRTIREFQEVKQELAAALTKARMIGNTLTEIGQQLRSGDRHSLLYGKRPIHLSELPTKEAIEEVVKETIALQHRQVHLYTKLRDMGAEAQDPSPR